ncbi:MAG: ABC-F family ATP-binding cassette domain-containing protein [Bradymonadales bacterium]|jgi:ATP-binding cassette subfamily F protein uup
MTLPLISIRNLEKAYAGQRLFDALSMIVNSGERIALIGRNGTGKSTLLKIIARLESHDGGSIDYHADIEIAYLAQKPEFGEQQTPRQVVDAALGAQRARIARYDEISKAISSAAPDELDALIHEQELARTAVEAHGDWELAHKTEAMLQRFGIGAQEIDVALSSMSGGQRRRVALAQALLCGPDLLLLDEPTNHLDTESIEALEALLAASPMTIIFVTHDRSFLHNLATRVVELHQSELLSFPGNYLNFVEQKTALLARRKRAQERYARLLVGELEWLRRGPKARTTKAQARIDRVHELQEKAKVVREAELNIQFSGQERLANIVIEAKGVSKSFGEKLIFKNLDLSLRKDDILAIIGANGCGKTTLLRVLTKDLEPSEGSVIHGKHSKISFLSQERAGLNENDSVYEALSPNEFIELEAGSTHKRGFLQQFLFSAPEQEKKVAVLSGGERCRLLFAIMVANASNILVLDEPTNDLDIDSLQCLEAAITEFGGAVLYVSHDRYFINRTATAILAFDPATHSFVRHEGDYDMYQERMLTEKRALSEVRASTAHEKTRPKKHGPRRLSYKESQELAGMEERILSLEAEKNDIETQLCDPEFYKSDTHSAAAHTQRLCELEQEINALYERWDFLNQIKEGLIQDP